MSRFLVTCWPLTGHVHGQLGIAEALRQRGHEVAFYTGPSKAERVGQAAFTVFPFDRLDEDRVHRNVAALEARDQTKSLDPRLVRATFRDWMADSIPDQVADITALVETWHPDVIVSDLSMWGTVAVLNETLDIPISVSSTFMGPMTLGRDAPPWGLGWPSPKTRFEQARAKAVNAAVRAAGKPVRKLIDNHRARFGLGPMAATINEATGELPLNLIPNVVEFDYGRRDLPPSVHYVGPCLWFPPSDRDDSAFYGTVSNEWPWVHVSEGTLHTGDPFLLRAAVTGLAGGPYELVATTGGHRDPASLGLGELADNVHITDWLSHADLIPRCDVIVTAGGAGTIIAAVAAGVPLVVVPTTWDKPDNAQRVVEAGVGVRLAPKECDPMSLRHAVDEVLANPAYRANAANLARIMSDAPGNDGAAALLEELATTGWVEPQVRS